MLKGQLPWHWAGVLLAIAFLMAIVFVKPIGVSTQFVIADGIVWDMVQPDLVTQSVESKSGYQSSNAYLNKSGGKYAKHIAQPLNYSFVFVLAMMGGAWLSTVLGGDKPQSTQHQNMPDVWRMRFGDDPKTRFIATFIAGFLVLFGARLAGGCTSGHMMSGIMQTALSGYVFALGVFVVAVPLAIFIFKAAKD